ncbi:MAG: FumA C-terminus/TtdB family hydratase beta subunit [Candidatus Bathyarchaeota archaeon]|nr:FumA C-terminus/TtdB family hydratase beta subunit [Candidatus Bathyarchaeota archaeon]
MAIHRLQMPISEKDARRLKVNDVLYVTGVVVTARDQAHRRALEYLKEGKPLPVDLEGQAVYHCGPVMKKQPDGSWVAVAAGPTTSTRLDRYEAEFISAFKPRIIIGKGGMGQRTTDAMAEEGAVYCAFTGGAAVLAAKAICCVRDVEWLDLGMPEAMWVLEVKEFGPLVVAIDAHGGNLYFEVDKKVKTNKQRILQKFDL